MHKHICISKLCVCFSLLFPGNTAGEQKMWVDTILTPRAMLQSTSYINLMWSAQGAVKILYDVSVVASSVGAKDSAESPSCCTGSFTASKSAGSDIFKYFLVNMV